jgi:hypothetical protein
VVKTLKDRADNHLISLRGGEWRDIRRVGNVLVNALMGSAMVKEGDILVEDPPGMALAENQNLIQAFAAKRTEEALTNRVSSRRS